MDIQSALLAEFPYLDPARIGRAVELVCKKGMVFTANRDEHGNSIQPRGEKLTIVRSSTGGYYYVRKGSCTCPDHLKGNICKHRIAAYVNHTFLDKYQKMLVAPQVPKIKATCPICGYTDDDISSLNCPKCPGRLTAITQSEMEMK